MTERLNRDPAFDVTKHIITGQKVPLSGDPVIQQYDAELDRNSPMDPMTAGVTDNFIVPQSASEVIGANASQSLGLSTRDIGTTHDGGSSSAVDLISASDWADEPTKGGLTYGRRNTGGDY